MRRRTPCFYGIACSLGCSLRKADLLNRCKVAAKSILLTCSRPCSHISGTIQYGFYYHVAAAESRSGKIATDLTFENFFVVAWTSCATVPLVDLLKMSSLLNLLHDITMSQIWVSHATHMNESSHTYDWVMSHIWMSHVTGMKASCHSHEWVLPHIWKNYVTHMNESCHKYERVISHLWMSPVTHMNESCHTYEWVLSHIWMSHVTRMNESWHTCEWVMAHIWMSQVTNMNES